MNITVLAAASKMTKQRMEDASPMSTPQFRQQELEAEENRDNNTVREYW